MANFELTGTVKKISNTVTIGKNNTKKRAVVITEDADKYPQDIKVEFLKDICDQLDGVKEGDKISVSVSVRGSEWEGKYYVNLQGWKINTGSTGKTTKKAQTTIESDDDLPF